MCYNVRMEKIVAFDVGDKRVGVAFSDPFGEYAVPGDTYFRTGDLASDARAVAAIAEERGADRIVCGLPLNADGSESVQTARTLRFIGALRDFTSIPVDCEDERYTTLEARQDLHRMGVSAKKDKKKKNVDSLAAAYILERYLENRKRRKDMKEIGNDYEDDYIVKIVNEDGKELSFEHLMTFEYKGEWYVALTPAEAAEESEDDDGGEEVVIYHLAGDEDDEMIETVEDDALLDEVFAEFCNLYEDSEDADEAAELDGGD